MRSINLLVVLAAVALVTAACSSEEAATPGAATPAVFSATTPSIQPTPQKSVAPVNNLGWNALLEAVILGDGSRRYQEIVTTLLAAGADPRIADRQGVTALQHADQRGQRAVARILRDSSRMIVEV
jgi:Ankyrin repeat